MISAFISIKDHLEFKISTLSTISMIIDLGWTKHKPSWKNLKLKITTQKINKNCENKTRSSQLFGWLSPGLVDRGLPEGNGWHFSVDSFCLTVCQKQSHLDHPKTIKPGLSLELLEKLTWDSCFWDTCWDWISTSLNNSQYISMSLLGVVHQHMASTHLIASLAATMLTPNYRHSNEPRKEWIFSNAFWGALLFKHTQTMAYSTCTRNGYLEWTTWAGTVNIYAGQLLLLSHWLWHFLYNMHT